MNPQERTHLPWQRRLSTRIAVACAVSAGVPVILGMLVAGYLTEKVMVSAEVERVKSAARLFAASSQVAMEFDEPKMVAEDLKRLGPDVPGLQRVEIRNKDDQVIASWQPEGAAAIDATTGEHAYLASKVAIAGHKEELATGTAQVWVSREDIDHARDDLWQLILLVLFLAVGLTTVVSVWIGSRVGRSIRIAAVAAEAIARGDLGHERFPTETGDEVGMLSRAMRKMAHDLRNLVRDLAATTVQLSASSHEIVDTAGRQEKGAIEQSGAVEETRRTMESLQESGRRITETSEGVLLNARRTQENNQLIAERTRTLTSHSDRIGEILEVIKEIANKSELLALNAALEGTKAGEVGRGFSLVAGEMQRLAEQVMVAVNDIKQLTGDIRQASSASILATEEGVKLAGEATSSAERIRLIAQQQLSGIQQTNTAMEDVAAVAQEAVEGNRQVTQAVQDLNSLSAKLQAQVEVFQLERHGEEHA